MYLIGVFGALIGVSGCKSASSALGSGGSTVVDDCLNGTNNCDQAHGVCTFLDPGFSCACASGYEGDGVQCTDVDECTNNLHNCDGHATCTNTDGAFTCACAAGYTGDGTICTDIDECTTNTNNCDTHATCTNTTGSFLCACNTEYQGDGVICALENECAANTDNCDANATCTNTPDAFLCTCNAGYAGDGITCLDVNECTANANNCDTHASCTNTSGSFTCACLAGFAGDGVTCTDIDECTAETDNCAAQATCHNTPGSFSCTCNTGYTGDGVTCTDINECTSNSNNCAAHAACTNTPGSYSCACDSGYTGDGLTCTYGTVVQVAAGQYHTCAVLSTGKLRCWGYGAQGQLGHDNTDNIGDGIGPSIIQAGDVPVLDPNDPRTVTQVAVGAYYSCALLSDGAVRCWGMGLFGQLGHGDTHDIGTGDPYDSNVRTIIQKGDVNIGGTVTQIVSGLYHVCALISGGTVRCWGANAYGQLGYGNTQTIGDDETPASAGDVNVGGTVTQLSAGGNVTCALLSGGNVRCWGWSASGQLGHNDELNHIGDNETPASADNVNVGATVTQIATGLATTCVLISGGDVRCWGGNNVGQLGYATSGYSTRILDASQAGNVNVGGTVTQLVNNGSTCVLLSNGKMRCWGFNDYGQAGYNSTNPIGDDETPAAAGNVTLDGSVSQMFVGPSHTCALASTTRYLYCWGRNVYYGMLGYGFADNNVSDGVGPTIMQAGPVPIF